MVKLNNINFMTNDRFESLDTLDEQDIYAIKDTRIHQDLDESFSGVKTFEDNIYAPNQLDYANITNCITEIPQDIKLELVDGVLTLKAGSKVYVPNGVGVFNEVNITEDRTPISNTLTGKYFIFITSTNLNVDSLNIQSGDTFPSSALEADKFYNIIENKFYRYSGTEWQPNGYSLPLAIVTLSAGSVTSIDQVFNGFGYIGSTIFALPGVKGLIPDGFNEDCSYKNIEFTTEQVITRTFASSYNQDGGEIVFTGTSFSALPTGTYKYDFELNQNLYNGGKISSVVVGSHSLKSGVFGYFYPKKPFQAVDRNDSSWLSSLGMPSDKYINLTLGASGATYTAPVNGWVHFSGRATANTQFANIGMPNMLYVQNYSSGSNDMMNLIYPILKGKSFQVNYNIGGDKTLKFYYAEGEK